MTEGKSNLHPFTGVAQVQFFLGAFMYGVVHKLRNAEGGSAICYETFYIRNCMVLRYKGGESPNGIELVFHTENSMKYRSYILFLNTVLTYHLGMKYQYFVREKSSFGMLKRYLRIVCKIGISYYFGMKY